MQDKNKGGRPRKLTSDKRLEKVEFRVTANEKMEIKRKALKAGLSDSDFMRGQIFSTSHSTVSFHKVMEYASQLELACSSFKFTNTSFSLRSKIKQLTEEISKL